MPPVSGISDDSIPTSAHALQIQKAGKALQKQRAQDSRIQNIIAWLTLSVMGITGTVIGYLLSTIVIPSKRRGGRDQSDSSRDEGGVSDTTLEDDALAIDVAGFGRRTKRSIQSSEEIEEIEELLRSKDFLAFLEEYE